MVQSPRNSNKTQWRWLLPWKLHEWNAQNGWNLWGLPFWHQTSLVSLGFQWTNPLIARSRGMIPEWWSRWHGHQKHREISRDGDKRSGSKWYAKSALGRWFLGSFTSPSGFFFRPKPAADPGFFWPPRWNNCWGATVKAWISWNRCPMNCNETRRVARDRSFSGSVWVCGQLKMGENTY